MSFQAMHFHSAVGFEEYPTALAGRIASRFEVPWPIEAFDFPEKGNINQQTFLILGDVSRTPREYILQQINQEVFRRPDSVMRSMIACLEAQRRALEKVPDLQGEWEPITLIPTREEGAYLRSENRRGVSYWRLMKKIENCRTFKSLSEIEARAEQLKVAEETGRGLAIYCDLTSEMDISGLENPLPGYRDTRLYYQQFHSVIKGHQTLEEVEEILPEDPLLRNSTEQLFISHLSPEETSRRREAPQVGSFIDLIKENEEYAMTLLRRMEDGTIRRVAIHGDTKLDNFLFSNETGRVRALVDLDTIMPHTWLADWGDMVRSLSNVAGEKEKDLERVRVDLEIFEALARGFLSTARRVTAAEVGFMVDAVKIIALELGIRFLTDHLRGDNYFKLAATDPPDLNRIRGLVQLKLFLELCEQEEALRNFIRDSSSEGAAEA